MRVRRITLTRVRMPFVTSYTTAGGSRDHVLRTLVELETSDGLVGLGETVGSDVVLTILRAAAGLALDCDPRARTAFMTTIGPRAFRDSEGRDGWMALAGIEMALWDLAGKRCGEPLHALLGGKLRDAVPLAMCVGAVPLTGVVSRAELARYQADPANVAGQVEHVAALVRRHGFRTVKLKSTALEPAWDLAVVRALREALGDAIALRIDHNAALTPAQALPVCRALEPFGLEYFEDPTFGIAGMARLRRDLRTPLATNMCVTDRDSIVPAAGAGAIDVLLGDVYVWGGIGAMLDLAAICRATALDLVVHSWFELGVATAANLHLSAALPSLRRGMDSCLPLYRGDIVAEPAAIVDGALAVPDGPGLGVALDPAAVAACTVDRVIVAA
jgi:glucarate dehydratase